MGEIDILKKIIKEEIKKSLLNEGLGDRMSKKISKHKGTRNRDDMKKVYKLLRKYGNNKKDSREMMIRNYDYVTKTYRSASPKKKAEILSSLSATDKPTKLKLKLKGRGVYQDFDGLDENLYYDEDKLLKLVDKDKFLKYMVKSKYRNKPKANDLKDMFDTYISGDKDMEKKYRKMRWKN